MAVPPHGYLDYNRAIPHGNDTALMFAARASPITSLLSLVRDSTLARNWAVANQPIRLE